MNITKRIHFIVEGYTEEEFIINILKPYFYTKGIINITCSKIKSTGGGMSKYSDLKIDIKNCIHQKNVIITTLIDYYGLPKSFPKYKESLSITNILERISFLENSIFEDIFPNDSQSKHNFIPYIQLHEFEALVFASYESFENILDEKEMLNYKKIQNIIQKFKNPEAINNSKETAPSKRLIKHITGYDKAIHGPLLIEAAGIETILKKCQRFNSWIENIIEEATKQ